MTTLTPPRAATVTGGRDGFLPLVHAEWTKLRTVRRWWLTLAAAVAVTVLISLFSASSSSVQTRGGGPPAPTGPEGQQIHDSALFVHRELAGDGSVTARVTGPFGAGPEQAPEWAKAGLLMRESTEQGAPYAALMLTAEHGVRLQSEYARDMAGSDTPAGTPRWLRLTREGGTITAEESADGQDWQQVGTVGLTEEGPVAVGMFVASPEIHSMEREFGNVSVSISSSRSTGVFDEVALDGAAQGDWVRTDIGARPDAGPGAPPAEAGEAEESGGTFTLTGSGDIGPASGINDLASMALTGSQLGLVLIAALGVLFITAEYRRGIIRTTFAVSPRRGRVLAAKALVIGTVAFGAGLVASFGSFLLTLPVLRDNGHRPPVFPEISLSDGPVLRAVIGTAAVLALIAVLALGLGALMRGTAAAITTVVVVLVLPLILIGSLPLDLSRWLQQATPIAGFAVQQTVPRYGHVAGLCLPEEGCYPQGPATGLLTLAAYAAAVLAIAVWRVRRRDA
ncbi:DUF1349 domain-containing protein [Streptomyces litchfieldiae]|uniref:ABC transporter permease subunit n=1 Tax=Streptomyces litchfieldiae TaxID=3075543 RepID=A0ABU2MSC7_9ACTN|nr:DUF1349 domain-containing protein [Streptomyces sp. DSM 44938]MDT0344541.1 ABC transporter permease subunit [Streptomyces sp. DSM 44938]